MSIIRVLAQLERISGKPEDRCINTFHFSTGAVAAGQGDYDAAADLVAGFYNTASPGGSSVGSWLSVLIATGPLHRLKVYDLADSKPRTPRTDDALDITGARTTSLPAEVALCLSYRGTPAAGSNTRRMRGRVYIGPLKTGAAQTTTTGADVPPTAALQTSLIDAGKRLMDSVALARWVVYSPTENKAFTITRCHVDNAFDTQRRRGARPTNRVEGFAGGGI